MVVRAKLEGTRGLGSWDWLGVTDFLRVFRILYEVIHSVVLLDI